MIVPGSGLVKEQAEAEGLDKIFNAAGFEWREPGCSMCLAMNPDKLAPGERCASTSNRNFEGRQGRSGRTHLVSPQWPRRRPSPGISSTSATYTSAPLRHSRPFWRRGMTSLVQKKFGEAASDYAACAMHAEGPSLARLTELISPKPTWRQLDIATGAGHTALAFAPTIAKATASDVTPEMLAEVKRLAKERGLTTWSPGARTPKTSPSPIPASTSSPAGWRRITFRSPRTTWPRPRGC